MLSKIIKNVALILDDKQALEDLYNAEQSGAELTNILETYISLTNFVLSNIAENFLCYVCTQELVSDNGAKLALTDLRYAPCIIKKVKDENFKNAKFFISLDYIHVENPNKVYFIEYAFLPPDLTNLSDTVLLPIGLDYKAICYGVVSEYYSLKMQFAEANIWEQKFKQSLRNLSKNYKEIKFANRSWL